MGVAAWNFGASGAAYRDRIVPGALESSAANADTPDAWDFAPDFRGLTRAITGAKCEKRTWRKSNFLSISSSVTTTTGGKIMADEWNVYKQSSNNACKVQQSTERPLLGNKHLGPFKSKADATKAMCADVDSSMSNPKKCWTTLPKDACKK